MSDLKIIDYLLGEIQAGKRFSDFEFEYAPKIIDGVRYDKCSVGYLHMPWLHNQGFLDLYALSVEIETGSYNGMAVAPRAYIILKAAEMAMSLSEGMFVECGVYKGGTALLACEIIHKYNSSDKPMFHLFDTFEGIPEQGLTSSEVEGG